MTSKRGRPKTGGRKGVPVGLRFTKELRDRLEDARRAYGRSLSQEIELRLWDSFTVQEKIEQRFGGHSTSAFLSIVADGIMAIQTFADEHWLDNPFVFEQVQKMLDVMLDHRKPRGRPVLPENIRRRVTLLKADAKNLLKADAKNIGQKTALECLIELDAAGNARVPGEFPPPMHYFDKPLARGLRESPLAKMEKLEHRREARRHKVNALLARTRTVNMLVDFLKMGLVEGASINIAKMLKGVTGENLTQQKPVIIGRVKSATEGKLIGPAPNFESDLGRLLDAAAKWETSDELISNKQHRDMQRRAEEAERGRPDEPRIVKVTRE
jgi:hypothetical protein